MAAPRARLKLGHTTARAPAACARGRRRAPLLLDVVRWPFKIALVSQVSLSVPALTLWSRQPRYGSRPPRRRRAFGTMRPPYLRTFVLSSLVACKPDVPAPIWKGEHLYYGTTRHETVRRGSFFRQEQHVVGLAALLGTSLPEIIRYTWVTEANLPVYCEGRSCRRRGASRATRRWRRSRSERRSGARCRSRGSTRSSTGRSSNGACRAAGYARRSARERHLQRGFTANEN